MVSVNPVVYPDVIGKTGMITTRVIATRHVE